ncbi:hypothetical protein KUV50_00270 [Membranicola marinus]|uniref:Uncharacterized protein n=1 Tax=Membranihabitans marinus TaxID=1227546 RepID=A0A953L8H2_9BACT|nr:hypothetical protein [Membranihabitans marinus]MBY5956548.1 hypothetical protein [Membranihabitans marinus]
MKQQFFVIVSFLFFFLYLVPEGHTHRPDWLKEKPSKSNKKRNIEFSYRADCAPARSEIDMSINNVRARLLGGGDVWWDLTDGKYIVPNVEPGSGLPEVSSIFAGAVWLGGYDPVGNLKLAAQQYRDANKNDFWPGPLEPRTGTVDRETCADWDRHFRVLGDNIRLFIRDFEIAQEKGEKLKTKDIPEDVLGWPARGNPHFKRIHGFDLPNTTQGLAAFFDRNNDFAYDPLDGDYPIIEIRGCPVPQYPDEMIFWIYNDAGSIHTQTQGNPIQMEVQVQAFAYATNDEINNMTFQRYKLINRATQSIDSTYFAMWVDPDLGCPQDDYIGSDTARSLAYVYNEDAIDGITGCECNDINTYCEHVPMLGIDYFRGPLDENFEEIGMSSFTYYNNGGVGEWPDAQTDPEVAVEYYRYMSGSWKDGTPFTFGGSGYDIGGDPIKYAFTEPPNDPSGWSMCSANLNFGDRRTIQASGPFRLDPGAVNELIIGVVWVPDIADYPCPSIEPLLLADETAQALFDNCFDITDGPDAPDMDIVELDRELILILSNDLHSNNYKEQYTEIDLRAPTDLPEEDKSYTFEGYKIYQLAAEDVSPAELDNPAKARLIFQTDIKNDISQIVNWNPIPHPTASGELIYEPKVEVIGTNKGIRHTFQVTEDQFARNDRELVNHKKYYFMTVAYAYNNFEEFDYKSVTGQRKPYLEGRRNVKVYTGLPRPITYSETYTDYGQGVQVTRLDGKGTGSNYLVMTPETRQAIMNESFSGEIVYEPGAAPIEVVIYNPLEVVDGSFMLRFIDSDLSDDELDTDARWELINLDDPDEVVLSDQTIASLNEQIIGQYGFSILIGDVDEPGTIGLEDRGSLGSSLKYENGNNPWLRFVQTGVAPFLTFVQNELNEVDFELDPTQIFSKDFQGIIPFYLADYRFGDDPFISPAWRNKTGSMNIARRAMSMGDLNNVDIILTPDKSKWSRCVVVETANPLHYSPDFGGVYNTLGDSKNFELRGSPSVGKEDMDGDGRPDPDGDGIGMGWFPGYAIDVETGERLNIFFGENSVYSSANENILESTGEIGGDMMWNPDEELLYSGSPGDISLFKTFGQHFVYVTKTPYDSCKVFRKRFVPGGSFTTKFSSITEVTWTGIPFTNGTLLSYADGLIPDPVTIELRVTNPYGVAEGTGTNQGHPAYRFDLNNLAAKDLVEAQADSTLRDIQAVPNPYLAYSGYETSQFTNTVKITNLPPRCIVTIYSLDGKFIRQYKRDETPLSNSGRINPGTRYKQVSPDLEWDLKNSKGIPIASGLYIIHVNAYELGERTIKWFGVNRKFDPSGL